MRVRIGQLKVGMYIEELESYSHQSKRPPFLVASEADLQQIFATKALSAVVNSAKGLPQSIEGRQSTRLNQFRFELGRRFSVKELAAAKTTITKSAQTITELLASARSCSFDHGRAEGAVHELMTAAADNAAALIGLTRLKRRHEATYLHSLSVSVMMIALGRAMGCTECDVAELGLAGLLHDIGKMKIARAILDKSGKLTREEYEIIKLHPRYGYEMLQGVSGISQTVLDVCLHHHERMDGNGYPALLQGDEIPFFARLSAICDVYDALTTIRPYKAAWTREDALEWMQTSEGHFDQRMLETFVQQLS